MADFSIDQNKLPGVKEVCRDFAVLEDHTLAHSLQEQEIESHLASNIHKSRLVQQDLQVAKRLQEEEDLRAKAQIQRQHKDIERSDNEIAQEIQEQLVRQAEQQRQQEENDEAIARKLQEREMKEERKRQKQLEANLEEEYYEEKGGRKVRGDYGLREAMQDMTHLDLRDQELKDLEVARRLQEEELKASKNDKRAAQVAQDEEIARLLMEEERKVYKKSREREKPCMDKRRPEGDWKPPSEEVVRPRSREEFDHQRPRNHKPSRPSPRTHDYENVDSSYAYPASPYSARSSSRPEATYKGSYYRQ
ncbi:coiled-coil domain-containing protein 50 isoform X1 [Megalops cyprinoides]|uniref:coiled-coil domain-containing protein 50 isoform X1 n=1 Tax=Megalops cyprinoides TaxID=118141 RepID=UPI001863BCB9|nr:coiled-coil domain-containing protein 50 isoform X1 [Megalops cyprinoides]